MTKASVSIPPPQRWSQPFDESMSEDDVINVLAMEPFASMDRDAFREPLTLEGIIQNDMRLRRFENGEIVVRAEDYGNSAFLIVRGQVRVVMPPGLSQAQLGRTSGGKKGWMESLKQLWANPKHQEARDPKRYVPNGVRQETGEAVEDDAEQGADGPSLQEVETLQVFDANGTKISSVVLDSSTTLTIGRKPENDIVLKDKACSGKHAQVVSKSGAMTLEDLNSLNGTSVNGSKIKSHQLKNGDEISMGGHKLVYERSQVEVGQAPEDADSTVMLWSTQKTVLGEAPPDDAGQPQQMAAASASAGGSAGTFLLDVPGVLNEHKTSILNRGQIFGEIAALGRTQRTATVFSEGTAVLLEIRWQGLRDIRRRDKAFATFVEKNYRERSLKAHLTATPLFAQLPEEAVLKIVDETMFETYGEFDWHTSYKKFASEPSSKRMQREPVIDQEGGYPDGLILIRSGFARVAQKYHNGQRTIRYLGQGAIFGFGEILAGWETGKGIPYSTSLHAVGYADILRVPTAVVESVVLPALSKEQIDSLRREYDVDALLALQDDVKQDEESESDPAKILDGQGVSGLPAPVVEMLVDYHYINGSAAMLINLDRCVRCDSCTEACAAGHNNNPRFNRHGNRQGPLMIANACMHCADPVCMIGCPTGAIHRASAAGQVVINDDTCIGCATCANSCPYNNIRMVDVRDQSGQLILDEVTNSPVKKATKCDLCIDLPGGPACQRACPHDALVRMDMGNLPKLASWLNR